MKNWNSYKNKTYTQQEARKMDYELDILHNLVAEVYNYDICVEKVKKTLDKIENDVHSKPK